MKIIHTGLKVFICTSAFVFYYFNPLVGFASKANALAIDAQPKPDLEHPNISPLIGHFDDVLSIDISADGKLAITGSVDKVAKIWNMQSGRVYKNIPHGQSVRYVELDETGKFAVTSSNDYSIIWNISSGQEVLRIDGSPTTPKFITSNNKTTVLYSKKSNESYQVIYWDPDKKTQTHAFKSSGPLFFSEQTSDKKFVLAIHDYFYQVNPDEDYQYDFILWDIKKGEPKTQIHYPKYSDSKYAKYSTHLSLHNSYYQKSGNGSNWVKFISLSPDGNRVILYDETIKTFAVWNFELNKTEKLFCLADPHIENKKSKEIALVKFISNEKFYTVSRNNSLSLWDLSKINNVGNNYEYVESLSQFTQTASPINVFDTGLTLTPSIHGGEFKNPVRAKGHYIVSLNGLYEKHDSSFKKTIRGQTRIGVFDTKNNYTKQLNTPEIVFSIDARTSSNAKWLAAVYTDSKIRVWNLMTGAVDLVVDGNQLVENNKVKDNLTYYRNYDINKEKGSGFEFKFSPDEKYLAISGTCDMGSKKGNSILLWDLETKQLSKKNQFEKTKLQGEDGFCVQSLDFNSKNSLLVNVSKEVERGKDSSSIWMWNSLNKETSLVLENYHITEKLINPLSGKWEYTSEGKKITKSIFTNDGKHLVAVEYPAEKLNNYRITDEPINILIIDAETLKINARLPIRAARIKDIKANGENDFQITLHDEIHQVGNERILVLDLKGDIKGSFKGASLLSNNNRFYIRKDTGKLDLFDSEREKKILSLDLEGDDQVFDLNFAFNNKFLLTSSLTSGLKIWDLTDNAKPVATTIVDANDEYALYTPDGYFDGSRKSNGILSFETGGSNYDPEQFAVFFNRPDYIINRFSGNKTAENYFNSLYLKRLKRLGIKSMSSVDLASSHSNIPIVKINSSSVEGDNIRVNFSILSKESKAIQYDVFDNGVPVISKKPSTPTSLIGEQKIEEIIPLTSGKNFIEISAKNEFGYESFREGLSINHNKQNIKQDLYFIGLGVSKYKDNSLELLYPAKDVKDFATSIQLLRGYNKIHVNSIIDKDVTISNIEKAKKQLSLTKVDDTVILFIAGHGIHAGKDLNYFYLGYDSNINDIEKTAIPFETIESLLENIPARNKIFLMDTCESGILDQEEENALFNESTKVNMNARTIKLQRGVKINRSSSDPAGSQSMDQLDFIGNLNRYIYNSIERRTGAVVVSSSLGNEYSYEPAPPFSEDGNGFFTRAIIDAINGSADINGDNILSKSELHSYVLNTVSKRTNGQQHPTIDRDNTFFNQLLRR